MTLRKRLALAAFVGDGHTTTALGREGRAAEDVAAVRPHKVLASERLARGRLRRPRPALAGAGSTAAGHAAACGTGSGEGCAGSRWLGAAGRDGAALAAAGVALDIGQREAGEPDP